MTLPVRGQLDDGSDSFIGTATGYLNGGGKMTLTSTHGLTCEGTFVYVTERTGQGTFKCNNNQSGPFSFVSTGTSGTGTGRLGNQTFSFTFG